MVTFARAFKLAVWPEENRGQKGLLRRGRTLARLRDLFFILWAICLGAAGAVAAPGDIRLQETAHGFLLRIALEEKLGYRVRHISSANGPVVRVEIAAELPLTFSRPGMRAIAMEAGWSGFEYSFEAPHLLAEARISQGPELLLKFRSVTRAEYAAAAPPKAGALPDHPGALVMLDPGHGGIDPGATRSGVAEKDIALDFARVFAAALRDAGLDVALTRGEDRFLSLSERVRMAENAGADLFLSIHANTVARGTASGAAVYYLSEIPSDARTAELVAEENGGQAELGADLLPILRGLQHRATQARSRAFGAELVAALRGSVGVLRSRPLRSGNFRVLKAPSTPSLLIELGFLGHAGDRANMQDPIWQEAAATALAGAAKAWLAPELALHKEGPGAAGIPGFTPALAGVD